MLKTDFNEPGGAEQADRAEAVGKGTAQGVGETFTLDRARTGAEVVVDHVDVDGAPAGRRLVDLGLLPDTPVSVVRRAPLGDPTEYALRGYRLCLRRVDAARIWVRARRGSDGD